MGIYAGPNLQRASMARGVAWHDVGAAPRRRDNVPHLFAVYKLAPKCARLFLPKMCVYCYVVWVIKIGAG